MLRIRNVVLDWLRSVQPLVAEIARHDANLANQLRRSSTSVMLNLAEGDGAFDGHRRNAYRVALKEMRESVAALEIAEAMQYVTAGDAAKSNAVDQIIGTLVKVARRG